MNKEKFEKFIEVLKTHKDDVNSDILTYHTIDNFTKDDFNEIHMFLVKEYKIEDDENLNDYSKDFPEFRWFFEYDKFKFILFLGIGQGSYISFETEFDDDLKFEEDKKIVIRFDKNGNVDKSKLFVGQTIYLERIKNNRDNEGIKEVTITKIGKKYFEVDPSYLGKFYIEDLRQNCGEYSSDYIGYLSKKEIQFKKEKEELISKFREFFGSFGKINNLPLEQLREINKIIER